MSDTRKRLTPSLAGLKKLQDEALAVLRREGADQKWIDALFSEEVHPLESPVEARLAPLRDSALEWFALRAIDTVLVSPAHVALVSREIRRRLREKVPLPPAVQDYLLRAIENRDVALLGWKGLRGHPVWGPSRKWARAVLVCYLANGNPEKAETVLDRVAELVGVTEAPNLGPLPDVWLWGAGIPPWYRAALAVRACRILLEGASKE